MAFFFFYPIFGSSVMHKIHKSNGMIEYHQVLFFINWSSMIVTARTNLILNPVRVKWQSAFNDGKDLDRSLQLSARASSNLQKQPDEWTWDGRKTTHSSNPYFIKAASHLERECAPSKRSIPGTRVSSTIH